MPEDDRNIPTPLLSQPYSRMSEHGFANMPSRKSKMSAMVIGSYVFDWLILIAVGVVGVVLGNVTPNKRPFSLQDPNISYVYPSLSQNQLANMLTSFAVSLTPSTRPYRPPSS